MLKQLRKNIINSLWNKYRTQSSQFQLIETHLNRKGIEEIFLDHFAIIDLPGPHSGIPYLRDIFLTLGYNVRGHDYLPDKQNDFCWLAEEDSDNHFACDVLPQVVVADFRLEAFPPEIKKIIEKYANLAAVSPIKKIKSLMSRIQAGDIHANHEFHHVILSYFAGRDWPLPQVNEFYTVKEFNELLAWVLIFGRQPNHFTLSVHLLDTFTHLADFHAFIVNEVKLELNSEGGIIKGGQAAGIAQGSTMAIPQTIALPDGEINLPTGFVEFVWRYKQTTRKETPTKQTPMRWKDYFTGFIAQHANHVIESLYESEV